MKDDDDKFAPKLGAWCLEHRKRLRATARSLVMRTPLPITVDEDDLAQEAVMAGVRLLRERRVATTIPDVQWIKLSEEAYAYARTSLKNAYLAEVRKAHRLVAYVQDVSRGSSEYEGRVDLLTTLRTPTPHDILVGRQVEKQIQDWSQMSKRYAKLAVVAGLYANGPGNLGDIASTAAVDRKVADDWRRMLMKRMNPKPGGK